MQNGDCDRHLKKSGSRHLFNIPMHTMMVDIVALISFTFAAG